MPEHSLRRVQLRRLEDDSLWQFLVPTERLGGPEWRFVPSALRNAVAMIPPHEADAPEGREGEGC